MATIAENLNKLQNIKSDIKTSLRNKGVEVTDDFSTYANAIDSITTGGGSSGGGGDVVNTPRYIQWDDTMLSFSGPEPMIPNVTYICTRPLDTIHLESLLDPSDSWHGGVTDLYNEYSVIFESNDVNITTPDYFMWANGEMPTLENGVRYELSIALMYINNDYIAHAVLTPFKPA